MTWHDMNDVVVFRPEGDVREGLIGDELERELNRLAAEGRRVLIDLGATRELSAHALGILAGACAEAIRRGGTLAICGVNERHRWLLGITELSQVLNVYDSESAAIAGLNGGRAVA
jgi:anti-anti-sigma factor